MDKLENVNNDKQWAISWLEQIKEKYLHGGDDFFDECRKKAIDIAVEQLKETKPIYDCPLFRCPRCRHSIDMCQKFCDDCGQPIDWKDGDGK